MVSLYHDMLHHKVFSVVYEFCGHGVGVEFHEDPQVDHAARKNSGPRMKPGMTFYHRTNDITKVKPALKSTNLTVGQRVLSTTNYQPNLNTPYW